MDLFKDVDEGHPDKRRDEDFTYYYNREERLKRAPDIVKKYYNGEMKTVRGIRVFFTKQNRYIFFALIFFVGAIWIYTGLNQTREYSLINGIDCNLQAFSYEEEVYVTIKFNPNKKTKELSPKKISAEILMIDPNNQVSDKQNLSILYESGEQYIRTKFTDYDIIRVDVNVTVGDETKEISSAVKR